MAKIGGVEVPDDTTTTLGSLSILGIYDGSAAKSAATGTLSESDNAVVNSGALSTYSQGISDFATANAQRKSSEGDLKEESAYLTAGLISDQQSRLARVGGEIGQYQEQRLINRTLGEQRAITAGSGFAASGSSIDIARDSAYQGAMEKSLIGLNADIKAGGYESEGAAERASAAAARAASDASLELATAAEGSGKMSTSLAALKAQTAVDDFNNNTTTTATGVTSNAAPATTSTTSGTTTTTSSKPAPGSSLEGRTRTVVSKYGGTYEAPIDKFGKIINIEDSQNAANPMDALLSSDKSESQKMNFVVVGSDGKKLKGGSAKADKQLGGTVDWNN